MSSTVGVQRSYAGLFGALAPGVVLAWGWPRRIIGLAAGACGALAMPPFGVLPALLIPMCVAVWLIDGSAEQARGAYSARASAWTAFAAGWWWGFGFFLAGLWWLGSAFLVDADHFAWALPLGVVGLPAALAIFPALGFALARFLWSHGALRVLALACGLGLSEWVRGVALTGFPWNDLGMALGAPLWTAEFASLVGLHGLTFLAIAIAAAPATLWDERKGWKLWAPTAVAALALAGLAAFGLWRLAAPAPEPVANARLRLMQPNVSQGEDFAPSRGAEILGRYLALSDRATSPERSGVADVTHLFWPESAFPFILARDAGSLARIADFLHSGATLVTGAARMQDDKRAPHGARYYNSIEVLDHTGLRSERYDKRHLVPFGEYVPFADTLARLGVTQFVQFPGGFDAGAGSNLLKVSGLPDAMAMVCYEAIFPNERGGARAGEAARAKWILNLTDDAWFGITPGPYQHFAQARLRAIELGLPLVRVANSGISAIIDSRGRIRDSAPLGVESIIDGALPGADEPTWQSRWGSSTAAVMALVLLLVSLAARRRM